METWCDFIPVNGKEGTWFCPNCDPNVDRPISSLSAKIFRKCYSQVPGFMTYLRMGMTYSQAVARHFLYGSTCTEEEIDARYSICSMNLCGHFKGTFCGHPKCGCSVNKEPTPLLNKLAMSSEQCPDRTPRWLKINKKKQE